MMRLSTCLALIAAGLIPGSAALAAPAAKSGQCFYTRDWSGWRAADPQGSAMYVRIGVSKIFRIGFAGTCREINRPGAALITEATSGQVCSAIDLTVKVSDSSGSFATPCIVSGVQALTQAEAAALPKKLTP